jgi:glycosyltransferase involved in cell wall biosynthesis
VWLYSHYASYVNHELVKQIAPDVPVLVFDATGMPGLDWALLKAQGLFRRLGKHFNGREQLVARHLRHTIKQLQIEVVNSHMIKSDYVAAAAVADTQPMVPLVITMHGCYEDFLHSTDYPEITLKSRAALQQAAAVVYLTAKNLEIFSVPGVRPLQDVLHAQIYNGFEGRFSQATQLPSRAQLGIEAQDLVFGMVARGIPEKGWQYAIDSFEAVQARYANSHLLLVGASDYLTDLASKVQNPHIHFVGFAPNAIDWVRLFDVGLLPSYFVSESLPNSLAEYLFCGVPVIATRIGEIPYMLETPTHQLAGVLIEQNGRGLVYPAQLTAAMEAYLATPALLLQHKQLAKLAFDKFRMQQCIEAYEAIFRQAQQPTATLV